MQRGAGPAEARGWRGIRGDARCLHVSLREEGLLSVPGSGHAARRHAICGKYSNSIGNTVIFYENGMLTLVSTSSNTMQDFIVLEHFQRASLLFMLIDRK